MTSIHVHQYRSFHQLMDVRLKTIKKIILITFTILPSILFAANHGAKSFPAWRLFPSKNSVLMKGRDPTNQFLYDRYPFGGTFYYGLTYKDAIATIAEGHFHRWPEQIQSLELSYTLNQKNIVRRIFYPVVGVAQIAVNVTRRTGKNQHAIYEFDPYFDIRCANFPWNHIVTTSLSIGEGVSYASSIPPLERKSNENTKRLLNLVILEATFALPYYPRWQMIARIHHRSGAYGLYHAGNTGSNVLGLGIRYLFAW